MKLKLINPLYHIGYTLGYASGWILDHVEKTISTVRLRRNFHSSKGGL